MARHAQDAGIVTDVSVACLSAHTGRRRGQAGRTTPARADARRGERQSSTSVCTEIWRGSFGVGIPEEGEEGRKRWAAFVLTLYFRMPSGVGGPAPQTPRSLSHFGFGQAAEMRAVG